MEDRSPPRAPKAPAIDLYLAEPFRDEDVI